MFLLNWLIFGIPWWVQVAILAVLALAALYAIGRIFGWGVARQIALPMLGLLGAIGLLSRASQQGYGARKDEEQAAQQKADQVAENARQQARSDSDQKLGEEVDRWSKP